MQILIVVIMAVVYGLSGIIKAAKSKKLEAKEGQGQQEQDQQGERARSAVPTARRQYRVESQPQRPDAAQPEPVLQKPSKAEQAVVTVPKEPQVHPVRKITSRGQAIEETISNGVKPQLAILKQQTELKPGIEELPEFISETVQGLKHQATAGSAPTSKGARVAVPAEIAETTYFGEPLLDASDPEALRRAILHYEILGKPLSLRGQGEHIIGL